MAEESQRLGAINSSVSATFFIVLSPRCSKMNIVCRWIGDIRRDVRGSFINVLRSRAPSDDQGDQIRSPGKHITFLSVPASTSISRQISQHGESVTFVA